MSSSSSKRESAPIKASTSSRESDIVFVIPSIYMLVYTNRCMYVNQMGI